MAGGRLFDAGDAATGKARSPRVDRCTDGSTNVMVVEVAATFHIGCPTTVDNTVRYFFGMYSYFDHYL